MKFPGLIHVILAGTCILFAERADSQVAWLEKDYDFGLIKEEAGEQTGRVRMVNIGKQPTAITGARPSCGCTGVDYPKDLIAPGDTAIISFTYNPIGRPGKFRKTIRVYVGDYDMATIQIRGNVLGTPESLSTMYPVEAGPLRLSEGFLNGGEVTYGSTRHLFLNGYNQSQDTIRAVGISPDKSLSVTASSEAIGPGDIVTFSFYLNTRQHPEIGPLEIPVEIRSDSPNENSSISIPFRAEIKPDFSQMTPDEIEKAPRCYLAPQKLDLGVLQRSGKKQIPIRFAIRNDGESAMHVMRIFSPSKAIRISRMPSEIKGGKNAAAEGSLNIAELPDGPFRLSIEVLTDDPLHPGRSLDLCGIIE